MYLYMQVMIVKDWMEREMPGRHDRDAEQGAREGSWCNCTALRKAWRRVSQLYDMALAPSGLLGSTKPATAPAANTSVALTCRWGSRPQHHKQTSAG
jgi:hypothetical protein